MLRKISIDDSDIRNILKIKALANSDKAFKRYVYDITEEEQQKYGFEFIGNYDYAPEPDLHPNNTTYRNNRDRCVYIKSSHGWELFLKDGVDGKNGVAGGGLGFSDVQKMIEKNLENYTPSGPSTSGGTYTGLSGVLELDTTNNVYTVLHDNIDSTKVSPIVSLNIPSIASNQILISTVNKTNTSFDILLSQIPPTNGYTISWFMPVTVYVPGYDPNVLIGAANVLISTSALSNVSGSNVQAAIESIDKKLNNEMILSTYMTADFESVIGEPEIIYAGYQNQQGYWYIRRVVDYNNGTQIVKHANISNNNIFSTYIEAWNSRAILSYGNLDELIFL